MKHLHSIIKILWVGVTVLSCWNASFVVAVERHVPDEYQNIMAAVDACNMGDEVIVADGTYTGKANCSIYVWDKNIVIRSKNGPHKTTLNLIGIDPDDFMSLYDCTLKGFTVTGANDLGKGYHVIYSVNSCISDCVIYNNRAGGISCEYTTVKNCTISNNTMSSYSVYDGNSQKWFRFPGEGGGIVIYDHTEIINCEIINNQAEYGGGICCICGNSNIINCTIASNTSDYGGGLCLGDLGAFITNSIIRNNLASIGGNELCLGYYFDNSGYQVVTYESSLAIRYSSINKDQYSLYISPESNISWGEGNIDADPCFVDILNGDYRLLSDSICRDAGYGVAVQGYDYDLDGNPRIVGNTVDMGAYEYQGSDPALSIIPIVVNNLKLTERNGQITFSIKGMFPSDSYEGQDVYVKIGSYEEIIPSGSGGLLPNRQGNRYSYKASTGQITAVQLDTRKNTFTIAGKGISESLTSPVNVEVAFLDQ